MKTGRNLLDNVCRGAQSRLVCTASSGGILWPCSISPQTLLATASIHQTSQENRFSQCRTVLIGMELVVHMGKGLDKNRNLFFFLLLQYIEQKL